MSKKRGAKAKKIADAQLWVQQLRIKVDLQVLSEEEGQNELSITVFSEPVPQVRMTRFSQHSNPDAIKYLGWKRKVSEAIKEALRYNGLDSPKPYFPGPLRLSAQFWISDTHRYLKADLDNFIKSIKDAINGCSTRPDRKKVDPKTGRQFTVVYDGATIPAPVWKDDSMVFKYGPGTGKYLETDEHAARIVLNLQEIEVDMPTPEPKIVDIYYVCIQEQEFIAPRKYAYAVCVEYSDTLDPELLAWKTTKLAAETIAAKELKKLSKISGAQVKIIAVQKRMGKQL